MAKEENYLFALARAVFCECFCGTPANAAPDFRNQNILRDCKPPKFLRIIGGHKEDEPQDVNFKDEDDS